MCAFNIAWLATGPGDRLSVLNAFLSALRTLQTQGGSWSDALNTLGRALAGAGAAPPGIDAPTWTALQAEWTKLLSSARDQLPAKLRPLAATLDTLGRASTPLTFPIVSVDAAPAVGPLASGIPATLTASANANAVVQAYGTVPDFVTAIDSSYAIPVAESLLRIELDGNVAAGAGATATPAWGKATAAASASASCALTYLFNYHSDDYLAPALLRMFEELPPPADLQRAMDAWRGHDFAFATLEVGGTAKLSANVAAGTSVVKTVAAEGSKPSWSPVPLGSPISLGTDLAATLSASWELDGHYTMSVRRGAAGPIVRVERKAQQSSAVSVDVSAQVGITGLQAALDPLMKQILPSAQPLIDRLGQLSDIHGLALASLESSLGLRGGGEWTKVAQSLLDVATGGGTPATEELAGELKGEVDNFIQGYLQTGSAAINGAVANITGRIAAALGGGAIQPAINQAATTALTRIGDALKQACVQLGTKLKGATDQEISQVCQALGQAGSGAAAFVADLQNAVNTAAAVVGAWLKKYEDARTKVAAEIAKVESEKIALDVSYSYSDKTESVLLIEVAFRSATPSAAALYKAFWTGGLGSYPNLIDSCSSEGSASELRGTLTRSRQRTGTGGFSFQFLGVTGQGTATDLEQISVTSDARTGAVIAASNSELLKGAVKMNGALSETSIHIGLEMLGAGDVQPPFDAQFKASGDQLTRQNIADFFAVLEGMRAVRTGTGAQVLSYLFSNAANAQGRVASAALNGKLMIDADGWTRLLGTTTESFAAAVRQHCMQALAVAVGTGAERGVTEAGAGPDQWVAMWLGETGWDEATFWSKASGPAVWSEFADGVYDAVASNGGDPIPHVQGGLARNAYDRSLHLLWQVAFIARRARQAWPAVVAEQDLIASLAKNAKQSSSDVFQRLSDLSRNVCAGLETAFELDIPDLVQPIKVSWRFLGVVSAFANLASPDGLNLFLLRVAADDHTGTPAKYFI